MPVGFASWLRRAKTLLQIVGCRSVGSTVRPAGSIGLGGSTMPNVVSQEAKNAVEEEGFCDWDWNRFVVDGVFDEEGFWDAFYKAVEATERRSHPIYGW
jgi:hypothetical protein